MDVDAEHSPFADDNYASKAAYVYILSDEENDYTKEEPTNCGGPKTYPDVLDTEESLDLMYHPNNCKVDNGDDTVDSDFDTDVEANADSGEKNEDNYDDELDEERLSNAASFNWDDDFILYDSDNDDIVG
ncbi:hypothetical protein ACOSQ3_021061 [Xanthoceras sorbifolium]